MASRVLYPPTIASSLPAFLASDSVFKIPVSFSKFNDLSEIKSAHISITKKDTCMSVINTDNDYTKGRYRATDIILNAPILSSTINGKTQYYVEIYKDDFSTTFRDESGSLVKGWTPGWFYKIQVRLSSVDYDGSIGQQSWLNKNASNFSEWSTVCITKAIGDIEINTTNFEFTYRTGAKKTFNKADTSGDNLAFLGNFSCTDLTETLAYYRVKLFAFPKQEQDEPIEDSGYIYNNAVSLNEFNYKFRSVLTDTNKYVIEVEYNTLNNYNNNFKINFTLAQVSLDDTEFSLKTVDNNPEELGELTSIAEEEEEGRIGLKIYDPDERIYSGNLCIRRASSRDNFTSWDDIKIVTFKNEMVNEHSIIYDYTAESGVWYKYGVQVIQSENTRSKLNVTPPIIRNYEYAYLLGENNQQLKLKFDSQMGSFTRNISESKVDTIGGKYAVFSRNAAMDYKSFPVNGLISFWMDEQHTFTKKRIVYGSTDIAELYEHYNNEREIVQYDYIYEREFRDLVSDFLHDGKPKLYKSPTEGNVIVRLMDISLTPNEQLSRLVYSFSGNAYELDDNTEDNYKKYNLIKLGDIDEDLSVVDMKLGQLYGVVKPTDNIFNLIRKKYYQKNLMGITHEVESIRSIKIQIDDKPMRVMNNANNIVMGYNIELNGQLITMKDNVYEIDPNVIFENISDSLFILNDAENRITELNILIDFIYSERAYPYVPKIVTYQYTHNGVGQIYGNYEAGTDLYKIIKNKYYYDWEHKFSKLSILNSVIIESLPGAVFEIRDEVDTEGGERHTINVTGTLALIDVANVRGIKYIGKRNDKGKIEQVSCDAMITYNYISLYGGYQ